MRLLIYDMLGAEVKTLVVGEFDAGTYRASWGGKNDYGEPVASGIYLYRIELSGQGVNGYTETRKMMLVK